MGKKHHATLFLSSALLILSLAFSAQSRLVADDDPASAVVMSDGSSGVIRQVVPYVAGYGSSSCEETYGFLPCTSGVLGNIFLILVYGCLMFLSAKMLSDGSEILLQILGPGIIGGLFLPILSALPDSAIILASGLSGSTETAQSQVSVGMGLMAGSNVLLLTLLWGSCLIAGKTDIEGSKAVDSKDTKAFSLTGSGITTDIWTSYAARIMVISVVPFIVVQVPQVFQSTSVSRMAVLASLVVSLCLLISYSVYQVFQPWIQRRKLAYAKRKRVVSGVLKDITTLTSGKLYTDDGRPNIDLIKKLFQSIDGDSDGYLTAAELRALIIGIRFDEIDVSIEDAADQVFKDFDTSNDSRIDMDEFVREISRWLEEAKHSSRPSNRLRIDTSTLLRNFSQQTKQEEDQFSGDQNDEATKTLKNPKKETAKAAAMLLLGTLVAAAFADPLVDAVDDFSTASSIPSFFVSFVILPFASSSEVVSDLIFASRKKSRSSSLAYSEIYGSVTMSNVLSLSVFLALVYFRGLTWDFSAEVLVIVIVCVVVGMISSFRTTFPLWMSLVAYALYPLSLLLAYVFDYVLGWS